MEALQPLCRLTTLPAEIQENIVHHLDLPDLLFPPTYSEKRMVDIPYGECYFDSQHEKYYGIDRNDTNSPAADALLNWSSTCWLYRRLLKPRLFRDLVLRTHLKSIASLEVASHTPIWRTVKSLVICNTLAEPDGFLKEDSYPDDENRNLALWPDFKTSRLSALLSKLPPSLNSLTLDFPWHWPDADDCFELYAEGDFAALIQVILRSVANNKITDRSSFRLKLLNVPVGITACAPRHDPSFIKFLNSVTNFTISLAQWDNGAGWEQNTLAHMPDFVEELGSTFVQHLTKVDTLEIQANKSCPIGLAPGPHHLPFPKLEATEEFRLHSLRNLTFDHFFIDEQMIRFLTYNAPNLEHLTLLNCGSHGHYGMTEVVNPPSWAELFTRLTTGAKHLQSLSIRHQHDDHRLLNPFESEEDYTSNVELAYVALDVQETQRASTSAAEWHRRKRIMSHNYLDDKYGMFFYDEDLNAERYLQGEDHRALLELWDAIEERGGKGVVFLPHTPETAAEENH